LSPDQYLKPVRIPAIEIRLRNGEVQRVRVGVEQVPTSVVPPGIVRVEAQRAGFAHDLKEPVHDHIIPFGGGGICRV
jgi:hypothetical protein